MSSTNLEDFSEIDFARAAESPPYQQWAHSGLRAGASPEQRTDGDQGCRNSCVRDDNPVDCKTLSVRRRLAEDLGCCGCTRAPETPCLVTDEDASTCCQRRRPATPRPPEANDSVCGGVDPVQQIIEEGLQRQKKRHHSRRQSSSRSGQPRRPNGSGRPSDRRGGYQPDYFDDQADMNNWQQHRDHSRRGEPRQRPSSPPPRPKSLAFEPYVDTEPYSPARPSTPGAAVAVRPQRQSENPQDLRQDMLLELQRLDEQRAELLQCMERERKTVEMVLEHQRQKRGSCPVPAAVASPCDDRQRIQRRIDEAKQKTAEVQRRYQQPSSSSSDGQQLQQCAPRHGTPAASTATGCPASSTGQRRKLHYQPPSPDTEDEGCAPPPAQRRLLKYNPPSSDSSDDDCGNAADECGGRRRSAAGDDRPSSLQDSSVYYNRSSRNGVPPVTADVPQQTSSLWTNP